MWGRLEKERGAEDAENIRPVYGCHCQSLERIRLYGHYARLMMEELRVEDAQFLFNYMYLRMVQCTRDILAGFEVACHIDSSSNETFSFSTLMPVSYTHLTLPTILRV